MKGDILMGRIKLPGDLKTKKIILAVLVCTAIGVIIKVGLDNKKQEEIRLKRIEEQRIQEEEFQRQKEEGDKKLKAREEELYSDAFTTFHAFNYKGAIEKADKLLEEFPNSALGYNIRGIAKGYDGNFEDGMKDIDKALQIDPNYGYALFNKALNYELHNKLDDALIWYDKALDVEEYVWSYYGIASIYGRRGDVDNVVKYLQKAIDIDDGVRAHAREESDFNTVRGNEKFEKLISD